MRIVVCTILLLLISGSLFSQDEFMHRGSIPEGLLRPRREESPHFPIDTIIGELGQGSASAEAYAFALSAADALLAGSLDAPILASLDSSFLEDCMIRLDEINPRSFRLGGGREEPDGAVSFLVRFIGRDYGITGELYIRFSQRRSVAAPVVVEMEDEAIVEDQDAEENDIAADEAQDPLVITSLEEEADAPIVAEAVVAAPVPVIRVWVFEDLILEEARSRDDENRESRQRFDFPPYERFF